MKILVVSHEYPPVGGGGANACFFLSREFARMGNQVTVITARFGNLPYLETSSDGVLVYRVKCKRKNKIKSSFIEMLSYLISAWKLAEQLVEINQFDKCLVFFGIPSGPIALHLKYKYHLPYVIRFGGGDIPGAQKRFKYVYMILSPFIRSIWKNADNLIANSEGLCRRAQQFEKKYKINIIENGVYNHFFQPLYGSENKTELKLLFVSRLIEGKGLQYIIPDINNIQKKVYQKCGKKIKLIIVGDGPYKAALEKLTQKTHTQDYISFEGPKEKEQVKKYYQDADLFILPSLSEGMPNVVLEAMACGLPIIMTPCEGSSELVTDNGIISPISSFADSIVKLCTDDKLLNRMGINSISNIKEHFQWGHIARRYIKLLEEKSL